jgi:hypothetical protein
VSYSAERCFDKSSLSEAKFWLQEEYGVEGEILYIAVKEEIDEKEIISESEIEQWRAYLEDKFDEEELEEFTAIQMKLSDKLPQTSSPKS